MARDPDEHSTPEDPGPGVVVPIGDQTLVVSPAIGSYLRGLRPESAARLSGTRVWIRRLHGELVVHVGDVEQDLEPDG
jgi:hypothetical protein